MSETWAKLNLVPIEECTEIVRDFSRRFGNGKLLAAIDDAAFAVDGEQREQFLHAFREFARLLDSIAQSEPTADNCLELARQIMTTAQHLDRVQLVGETGQDIREVVDGFLSVLAISGGLIVADRKLKERAQ